MPFTVCTGIMCNVMCGCFFYCQEYVSLKTSGDNGKDIISELLEDGLLRYEKNRRCSPKLVSNPFFYKMIGLSYLHIMYNCCIISLCKQMLQLCCTIPLFVYIQQVIQNTFIFKEELLVSILCLPTCCHYVSWHFLLLNSLYTCSSATVTVHMCMGTLCVSKRLVFIVKHPYTKGTHLFLYFHYMSYICFNSC